MPSFRKESVIFQTAFLPSIILSLTISKGDEECKGQASSGLDASTQANIIPARKMEVIHKASCSEGGIDEENFSLNRAIAWLQ